MIGIVLCLIVAILGKLNNKAKKALKEAEKLEVTKRSLKYGTRRNL